MKSSFGGVVVVLVACGAPAPSVPKGPPANAAQFTLQCPERGLRAFDQARGLVTGVPLACAAHAADRQGTPLKDVAVSFLVEAGRVTAEPLTSATGSAAVAYETALPLPAAVEPGIFSFTPLNDATHTGAFLAPLWMMPFDWNENPVLFGMNATLREPRRPDPLRPQPDGGVLQNNPRDNLVTLMAWADGEEGFVDANANGTWDPGETFMDLTEPFLDVDDDGTWTEPEQFIDTNANGRWDGKNAAWDAQTKIWVQERVLWTGVPAPEDVALTVPGVTGHRPTMGSSPRVALSCTFSPCASAGRLEVVVFMSDPWFNRLAHEGSSDECRLAAPPAVVVTPSSLALSAQNEWPASQRFLAVVSDSRDPATPTPRRTPPLDFTVPFLCTLSATRSQPAAQFVFNVITGSIE
ncbi:MAG: hypothetical protein Q8L48_28965 [Archangium sp.]|nr:hypothetical protein [Archangium sp.]